MPMTAKVAKHRVGVSSRLTRPDGGPSFPSYDLTPLKGDPAVELIPLPAAELLQDEHLGDVDAVILGPERITAKSFGTSVRLALIVRVGVGFDQIELSACTSRGVAVTNAPEGVKRPMAVANMTLLLALAGNLRIKDSIVRRGGRAWPDRMDHHGVGLVGKTLGSVGLGNVGAEVFRLARPFGLNLIASDPYLDPQQSEELGVEMVDLDTLFTQSDFLVVNCPLTHETRHIVSRERISLMKSTAYLINAARGPLVDQVALYDALVEGSIAGAGLDTFDPEPPESDDRLLTLDNVILTPHSLGWTDQMFAMIAEANVAAIQAAIQGKAPANVVNPQVLGQSSFLEKLAAIAARS